MLGRGYSIGLDLSGAGVEVGVSVRVGRLCVDASAEALTSLRPLGRPEAGRLAHSHPGAEAIERLAPQRRGVFGEDQPLNALAVGAVALMRDEMFRRRVEVKLNEAVVLAIELDFAARIVLQFDRVIAVDQVRGVDES